MKSPMFPHTVTIYNVTVEETEDFREETVSHITVLDGVFLDESKGVNVIRSGLTGADSAVLYIPFDVDARDGVTGEAKRYAGPMEWTSAAPADRSGLWTMTLDGQGDGDSFFIAGEIVEENLTFDALSNKYDGVYNITKVDAKDYGIDRRLCHWEVGGA